MSPAANPPKARQHAGKAGTFVVEYADQATRDAQLKCFEEIQREDTEICAKKRKSFKKWHFNCRQGGETRDVLLVQGFNTLNMWGFGPAEGNKAYIVVALEMTDAEKLADRKLGKAGEAMVNYKMKKRAMEKIEKLLGDGYVGKEKEKKTRGCVPCPVTFEPTFLSIGWLEIKCVPVEDLASVLLY
ncbi:hypothetical protein B0T21DRAFT_406940 [Apiosordaria backusii]|uniref:Uncharacterized protein n=1 Tax=Apiosordaria backusii TaxID=314023 RepID=A0AA40EZI1_9PEZI|nr:hypothetical protein B0T21DRAFT_406940 [Apiosordaria backusii]